MRSESKDFTPEQAERWVEQEIAKVDLSRRASVESRLASERQILRMADGGALGDGMPNSIAAHRALAARLEAALPQAR